MKTAPKRQLNPRIAIIVHLPLKGYTYIPPSVIPESAHIYLCMNRLS